jgi:hypothetical protein
VSGRDIESSGAGLPGTPPDTLADLPGYLLALAPEQVGGVFVEAFDRVTEAEGGRLDWRGVALALRAVRAQWRRGAGNQGEHTAMLAEMAERLDPTRARRGPFPTTLAARRQRLGSTQRAVLAKVYRLVPEVGDTAPVWRHFPACDDRKALARLAAWAPGLELLDDGDRRSACIRRTAPAHDEIDRLLGPENPPRQGAQDCGDDPARGRGTSGRTDAAAGR